MTVSTIGRFNAPRRSDGGVGEIAYGANEANSMTFAAGHFVYSNAGAITDAEPSTKIMGIAKRAATEVTSGNVEIPVELIDTSKTYLIRVEDGSGNLEASDTTCVEGVAYGILAYSGSNESRIDSSNTTNDQWTYIGPVLDAAGDSSYWGRFRAVPAAVQGT